MIHELYEEELTDYIEDNIDYYILGLPVKTRIGFAHFLKVKDFPKLDKDIQLVSWTKLHFINEFSKEKDNEEFVNEIRKLSLLEIVLNIPELTEVYHRVFTHFFKSEKAFGLIESEEEFEYLRGLVLRLSCVREEKINPNPEIQKFIERSREAKSHRESIDFATIISSVSTISGKNYHDINEMTLYQLYMDFYRVSQKTSYDTTTLFATVSNEVNIEEWNKNIDLFEEEKHSVSIKELGKISKQIE